MKASALALALGMTGLAAAQTPTLDVRRQVLRALVQVTATDCPDGKPRSGSGFALEAPGRIVTAHHVVGGCDKVQVSYEAVKPPAPRRRVAQIERVQASGDLSLLLVRDPPDVPVLRLATGAPVHDRVYAGAGYPLGVPTAGDQLVTFSVGGSRLRDILPEEAAQELRRSGSAISTEREVLRFNVALQPGMSGGPIVDVNGAVIGVVAGGLKAGAAPVSWGWPTDGVRHLLTSTESVSQPVRLASTQYSLPDLQRLELASREGRRLRCGELEFIDTGARTLTELMRGADDWARVQYILRLSGEKAEVLGADRYQVWVHQASGATAVVPSGYSFVQEGTTCVARSTAGNFQQLVWAARAPDFDTVQARSLDFERDIVQPRAPYFNYVAQPDPALTTFVQHPQTGQFVPGPQFPPTQPGLVFTRKGGAAWTRPPQFYGDIPPFGHVFETLVARSGNFLGVATLNGQVHPLAASCSTAARPQDGCVGALLHLREWTRFVLATQLSTFPAL